MLSYSVLARVLIVTISTRTFVLLLVMTDHAAVQEKQMDFIVALMKNYMCLNEMGASFIRN